MKSYWAIFALLIASTFSVVAMQDRYGIHMFVQEAEPTSALSVGTLWYKASTSEARLLVSTGPSVWRFTDGGIGRATPTLSAWAL